MIIKNKNSFDQSRDKTEPHPGSQENFDNLLRILTLLEKAVNRLVRRNYFSRNQYPPIVLEIEDALSTLRAWIQHYKIFAQLAGFGALLGLSMVELGRRIDALMASLKPLPGKKEIKKSRRIREQQKLCQSIDAMLDHLAGYVNPSQTNGKVISIALEEALYKAFERHVAQPHAKRTPMTLSHRGGKTYIFPCADKDLYLRWVNDRKRFRIEVVDPLEDHAHATGHRPGCDEPKRYSLCGFRQHPRKTIMTGGNAEPFPIRMVQCLRCHQKFSLLPSFLPREKHFGIDLISQVFQNIFRFSQSIQAALENFKGSGATVKSKQTIFNWLRWIGTLHPATILTRAGIVGSGYLQEDEGFEKEPHLRTYAVIMVDPQNLLVWHADYVDHVDEQTLCSSFETFIQRIHFKVLGVTKDKWQPSTRALKTVFHRIWIGFCRRHWLKKFHQALRNYREKVQCRLKNVDRLYKKVKKILETSTSKVSLQVKVNALKHPALAHPLVQQSLAELKDHAVHYTSHKNRNGITKTTSIIDNFLKTVKRKLRQVESFRDQECTRLLFQAMANTRNFLPFLSGAKHAHQSPFMIAQGKTWELPWIQVMNIHNAFLFTANAC